MNYTPKTIPFKKLRDEMMKDLEFRREYKKLEPEFQIERQKISQKTISITQFRKNIGMLKTILKKYGEAFVTKNRAALFVAITEKGS